MPILREHARRCAAAALALLASGCALVSPGETPSPPSVSLFVVAHQDDWQLFMNPAAYHAMNEPQERAVFVHVTAGDAGAGAGGAPVPYYLAREEGALRAVRFMANAADPESGRGATMDASAPQIAGHAVARYSYANAVVYFLRLPDGFIVEDEVRTPHPRSLTRLRMNQIPDTQSIDGAATYSGWNAVVSTLSAIVEAERRGDAMLSLHIAETDERRNPGDHPDHRSTALAMEAVAERFPCARIHRHAEYATRRWPRNVSGDDYMIDVGAWAATASGLSDSHADSTWDASHNAWMGRSYSRTTGPRGACAPAGIG